MNKKVSVLLICLVSAIVLLVVGMIQKNQIFIILACTNAALGSTFYAIGGQKKYEKDGDYGKKS
ncbi:potassium transporter [Streptococcus cristatus]|uniref:Potassium transporter n=1 Tax=Streptococcus cristatus TaxID=45634 RepID=A0AAW5WPL4_STRCR|nr:potassium transporter [Streptococcus cristatus]MCY7222010.1 potassium transporter [Streptococcus cristatus]